MESFLPGRVLFVHAHPDDETITTGGTLALLGDRATLLTCTLGELGEVIPADLRDEQLGPLRQRELAAAMEHLGVRDHRLLGWRDSGMRWGAGGRAQPLDSLDERCLSAAPLALVVAEVAAVIVSAGVASVVSYAADGGYGHPDHVRAHEAARAAADAAGLPFYAVAPNGEMGVDVTLVLDRKRAALTAHRTQVVVIGDRFELSNGVRHDIDATEWFTLLPAQREPVQPR